jgi:hypothetical protein
MHRARPTFRRRLFERHALAPDEDLGLAQRPVADRVAHPHAAVVPTDNGRMEAEGAAGIAAGRRQPRS